MRSNKPYWLLALERALQRNEPERGRRGRSLVSAFTNCFGQRWAARVTNDAVYVTGEGIGWQRHRLNPEEVRHELMLHRATDRAPLDARQRKLAAPLVGAHVIADAERAWWISVLTVAEEVFRGRGVQANSIEESPTVARCGAATRRGQACRRRVTAGSRCSLHSRRRAM
jgi:hypothetical protein